MLNKIIHENNFIKAKELKLGATYIDKNNESYIYLGKFEEYDEWSRNKKKGKSFFFARARSYGDGFYIDTVRSMSKKFISCSNEECVENYADLMDLLECDTKYSPIDDSKDLFIPYTYEEFIEKVGDSWVHFSNDKSSDTYRRKKYEVNNRKREEEHKPYFTTEETVSRTNHWAGAHTNIEKVKNYRGQSQERCIKD